MALNSNPYTSAPLGALAVPSGLTRQAEYVDANKTLDEGDIGVVQVVTTDAVVITLPSTAAGLSYTVVNGAPDGTALVSVAPAAADKIIGNGFTSADNKAALNTKATAKRGDMLQLVASTDGWAVVAVVGIWARAA